MESNKLKVGIMGLGHQSYEDHIPALRESKDAELVAVAEVDDKKLKEFLKENKNIKGYNSYKDLIKNHKLDFVIIAVPHFEHCNITKTAIENKINVLKEKPFAMSLREAMELKELAEKNNVKFLLLCKGDLIRYIQPFSSLLIKLEKFFI